MSIFGIVLAIVILVAGCYLVSKSPKADNISKWFVGEVNPLMTLIVMLFCFMKDKKRKSKD